MLAFIQMDFEFSFGADALKHVPLANQGKHKKHKREVCRYWLESRCQKGLECEFLHQLDDSKMPSCPRGSLCDRNPAIQGIFEPCPFRHDLKKSRCVNYDAGFCSFGLRCPHEHVLSEGPPPVMSSYFFELPERPVNQNFRKAPCSYWTANQWCPYFDMCNFAHK